jgi:hypothetical protein
MTSSPTVPPELLSYSEATIDTDYAYLHSLSLSGVRVPDATYLNDALINIGNDSCKVICSEASPRPSLALLYKSFTGLRGRDKPPEELTSFICDLLTLAELPWDASTGPDCRLYAQNYPDTCKEAEPCFYQSLQQIEHGSWQGQQYIDVYHDPSGIPLILEKSQSVNSALTLQPMHIGGLPIVPGTIVKVSENMRTDRQTGKEAFGRATNISLTLPTTYCPTLSNYLWGVSVLQRTRNR